MTAQAPNQTPVIACEKPTLEKLETWINRPLTSGKLPVEFNGMSYSKLAADEEGRLWLVTSQRGDPFAEAALKNLPHVGLCECSSCNAKQAFDEADEENSSPEAEIAQPVIATVPVIVTIPEVVPVPVIVTPVPSLPVPVSVPADQKTQAPPAKPPAAPTDVKPDGSKKVKLKKQSVAGVEVADANLDVTKKALEIEEPLNKIMKEAEFEEDQLFISDSVSSGSYIANANRKTNRDDILKKIALRININNGWAAAWAAKQVLLYEDIRDEAKRQAQAIVDRAERDYEIREKALMPKLTDYANAIPVEQRSSEKSVRLPGWGGRLTFRWRDEDYEIVNESMAKRSAEEKLGTDECIANGIIKIEEKLSETGLRSFLIDHKEKALLFQGVRHVAGRDKLTLYRK